MRVGGVGRRVASSLGAWILVLGLARGVVLWPERCPPVDPATVHAAAAETVDWFERNQHPDGTWLYRYDASKDEDLGGYNTVRHAGVVMSLYQAAGAGLGMALPMADRGTAYAEEHLVEGDGWVAFEPHSPRVTSGASALLIAGLAERRLATGDGRHDELMAGLARFLLELTEENGAVLESWDRNTGAAVPGQYSPFFTGEVFWAFSLMDELFPHDGWDEPASRIARYLATERDSTEGRWPDIPDHWAAYGFEVLTRHRGHELAGFELSYLRRQAGLGGLQTRYESQRVDSFPQWWLRGRRTLGAGLGTVGEQVGGLWRVAQRDPDLAGLVEPLAERGRCLAGMLVDRQVVDDADMPAGADPDRTRGAWFQFGITQMDDQQHALSALLLAIPMVEEHHGGE